MVESNFAVVVTYAYASMGHCGTTYVCCCNSEQNVGIQRRTSVCCVAFGVTIVYVASVIIHLAAGGGG